jgi:amino acid transporter
MEVGIARRTVTLGAMSSPDAATNNAARPALIRAIGRWDLTAAVVNGIIGSAIFGLPGAIAALTGALSPLTAVVAGAALLCIVFCIAEVASRFSEQGGMYLYARTAFGPTVGFQVGWLFLWTRALSAAANINLLAVYLAELVPGAGVGAGRVLTMAVVVSVWFAVNLIGVRQATWAINAFTLAKLAPIALLIVLGLPQIDPAIIATQHATEPDWAQALVLLMFALGGFETALVAAGEQKNPQRDAARALILGVGVVAAIYALVQLVVIGTVANVGGEAAPFARALDALLGAPGLVLASVAAVVSVFGWGLLSVMQAPRMIAAMAERRELPSALARIHPRFRTPDTALLVFALVIFTIACAGSFTAIAALSAIVRLVYYAIICAALPVLRRREAEPAPFRLPLAGLVLPLAIGFCLWLLSTRSFDQAWILLVLIMLGLPLYLRGGKMPQSADSKNVPRGTAP